MKQNVTVRQLLEYLHKYSIHDPSILDKALYIEASDNFNFEDPKSGWKSFRNCEDWLFVQPAWDHGVLVTQTKDKFCLQINY